jgi:hypothetical protein
MLVHHEAQFIATAGRTRNLRTGAPWDTFE